VAWLLKEHRPLIDAELALNEGGGAALRDGRRVGLSVQVSEKIYQSFELESTNRGGHSSFPERDNAIYDITAALERLARMELPARLGPVARAYAASAVPNERGPMAEALRAIASGIETPEQVQLASTVARYNAQFRTTCVATRIQGGHADNALPMLVRATVNCRLLPDEDEATVKAALEAAAGERVKIRAMNALQRSPPTDPASPAMAVIAQEAKAQWPEVSVQPVMIAGATDGSKLRNAGIPVYGLLPFFMAPEDFARAHGRDERIPVHALEDALAYFDRLVRRLAGGP
jgi:acetylornithine deacetylase/succinyl-diaminopimelate desuccinylase-like protein